MTRFIVVMLPLLDTRAVLVPLLERIQQQQPFRQIVDMGSGEVMPSNKGKEEPAPLLLTDLPPSSEYRQAIKTQHLPHVQSREQSLDATQLEHAPEDLKTMICSFHYLPSETAKAVLCTAPKPIANQ